MIQKSTLSKQKRDASRFEVLSRDLITRILGTVAHEKAFFFYTDIAQPTGDYAVSLLDLCNTMNTTAPKSLAFHLKRGDFENWIREIIGDSELADRISKLKKLKTTWKNEATTRRKLCAVVQNRVTELQELWRHALTWPERAVA
jgi:hypothetical protein